MNTYSASHAAALPRALRALIAPVMLALALLSSLMLYANWGPGSSEPADSPAATSAWRTPTSESSDPSVPAASQVFTSPYEEIAHVQAF